MEKSHPEYAALPIIQDNSPVKKIMRQPTEAQFLQARSMANKPMTFHRVKKLEELLEKISKTNPSYKEIYEGQLNLRMEINRAFSIEFWQTEQSKELILQVIRAIKSKQNLCYFGPNRIGKSTLLKVINSAILGEEVKENHEQIVIPFKNTLINQARKHFDKVISLQMLMGMSDLFGFTNFFVETDVEDLGIKKEDRVLILIDEIIAFYDGKDDGKTTADYLKNFLNEHPGSMIIAASPGYFTLLPTAIQELFQMPNSAFHNVCEIPYFVPKIIAEEMLRNEPE